ncbi:FAD/NAD(P)-binding domain-containing protein [Rhizopogon vinicolor AM-OR11-026]|uniref:FAD/NAD(P)-binding domain-containing protein n=1 Tax=Rhizopogon vinicolor AM-OR11-026 TaxID=1314800 RepID=A0A1B7ND84_9AGAM|nr:FAD/NAD(P)-binding domain-containing protein [Rhizopogon vinicolor AM-OR11-026]
MSDLQRRVAIIGAGIGGLSQAIALKTKLGFNNFTLYEKASEVGGVWRANAYPGCSSDVQIHWYSLSTDLYPYWNKSHGLQPEIQAYWVKLTKKYNLYPHITFNTKVLSAEWDNAKQQYALVSEDVLTGKRMTSVVHIVISAVGILEVPNIPYEIPGFRKFQGTAFHSAQWPESINLQNKRVAVIGNASSGAQFVPSVSKDPSVEVVNFIRTPTWFNLRPHIPYSDTEKWIFANIPLAMRLHRAWIMFWFDFPSLLPPSDKTRKKRREAMTKYIIDKAPSKYHAHMIPDYPVGCKRTVADSGFLDSLHRPNLALNFDGIAEIVENGIVTKTGEMLPFDVIAYATGFIGERYPMHVQGLNGVTIQGYYDAHGGPAAYFGTAIPDIPNFYLLAGPNTGTPTSTMFVEEVQIGYILQLVEPVINGSASSFSVKAAPTDAYNAKVQERISRSVFVHCNSWARTNGTGKVFNPFPWAVTLWWWWLRKPNWAHFMAVGAEKWARKYLSKITLRL